MQIPDRDRTTRTGWNIVLAAPAIWMFCLIAALFTASSRLQLEPKRFVPKELLCTIGVTVKDAQL